MEPEEEDRKQYLEDFMVKVKKAKLQKVQAENQKCMGNTNESLGLEESIPYTSTSSPEIISNSQDVQLEEPSKDGTTETTKVESDYVKRHLDDYYKLLDVQPRRHTEEQKRRERPEQPGLTPFQQELFKLRENYKREFINMTKEKATAASSSADAILNSCPAVEEKSEPECPSFLSCPTPQEEVKLEADICHSYPAPQEEELSECVISHTCPGPKGDKGPECITSQSLTCLGGEDRLECITPEEEYFSAEDGQSSSSDSADVYQDVGEARDMDEKDFHNSVNDVQHLRDTGSSSRSEEDEKSGRTHVIIPPQPHRPEETVPVSSVPVSNPSAVPGLPPMMTGQPSYNSILMCPPPVLPSAPQPGPTSGISTPTPAGTSILPPPVFDMPAAFTQLYYQHLLQPGAGTSQSEGDQQAEETSPSQYPLFLPFMFNPTLTPEAMGVYEPNLPFPPYMYVPQPNPPTTDSKSGSENQGSGEDPGGKLKYTQSSNQGVLSVIPGINPLGQADGEPVVLSSYARKYTSIWDISDSESESAKSIEGDQHIETTEGSSPANVTSHATVSLSHKFPQLLNSPTNPIPKPQRVSKQSGSRYHGSCGHQSDGPVGRNSPSPGPRPRGRGRGTVQCPLRQPGHDSTSIDSEALCKPEGDATAPGPSEHRGTTEEVPTSGAQGNAGQEMVAPIRPRYGPRSITHASPKASSNMGYGPRAARRKALGASLREPSSPTDNSKYPVDRKSSNTSHDSPAHKAKTPEKSEKVKDPPGFNYRRLTHQDDIKNSVEKVKGANDIQGHQGISTNIVDTNTAQGEALPARTKTQFIQTKTQSIQTKTQPIQRKTQGHMQSTQHKPESPPWNASTQVVSYQGYQPEAPHPQDDHQNSDSHRGPPCQARSYSDHCRARADSQRQPFHHDRKGRPAPPRPPMFQRQGPPGHSRRPHQDDQAPPRPPPRGRPQSTTAWSHRPVANTPVSASQPASQSHSRETSSRQNSQYNGQRPTAQTQAPNHSREGLHGHSKPQSFNSQAQPGKAKASWHDLEVPLCQRKLSGCNSKPAAEKDQVSGQERSKVSPRENKPPGFSSQHPPCQAKVFSEDREGPYGKAKPPGFKSQALSEYDNSNIEEQRETSDCAGGGEKKPDRRSEGPNVASSEKAPEKPKSTSKDMRMVKETSDPAGVCEKKPDQRSKVPEVAGTDKAPEKLKSTSKDARMDKETSDPAGVCEKKPDQRSKVPEVAGTDKAPEKLKSTSKDARMDLLGADIVDKKKNLDDRIKEIQVKNCKILERQKEIEEDIKAAESRV